MECIHTRTRRRLAPSTCTTAYSYNTDCGSHLATSTVGTTPPREGGVGSGRSDANTDGEGEAREGGNVGEDEELIGRCGDDTVYAAGGCGRGEARGKVKDHTRRLQRTRGAPRKGKGRANHKGRLAAD